MQRHENSFVVKASPAQVWAMFSPPAPAELPPDGIEVREHENVRIEILHQGNEVHEGLVRHCYYPVPRYLISGGVAESWELVTDVVPNVSSRYRAITRPPFAVAEGWHRLEDLGDGRTRMIFVETYSVKNPLLRFLFERRVHDFISKNNDALFKAGMRMGVEFMNSLTGGAAGAADRAAPPA
jgi:hypothetical protein